MTHSNKQWEGRSRGGGVGHAVVALVARWIPWAVYIFVAGPATYFFLIDAPSRRAIRAYWQRMRPGLATLGLYLRTWRHFHHFACMLSDRLLAGAHPAAFPCVHLGEQSMLAAMDSGRGCILLSAHIGNWELAGRWLARYGSRPIHIVMMLNEDPRVAEQIEAAMGSHPFHIIDLSDGAAASIAIASALAQGDTCCMLGDRTAGDPQHSVRVPFLGAEAAFPIGPFHAALVTGAYIVPTFALKRPDAYHMVAWPAFQVQAARRSDRRAAIAEAQQRFIRYLSYHVRRDPYQWHNFFDFWA